MTVRQVFYQLEMSGVVKKTEAGYRQVQKQLLVMRREGLLGWKFITDGTRWQRKPRSYDDAGDTSNRSRGPTAGISGRARECGSRSGWRKTHWRM